MLKAISELERCGAQLAGLPPSAQLRFMELLDWAKTIDWADNAIDAAGLENIIAAAQRLYDTHIAPVDIPWVPQLVESTVIDPAAKLLIEHMIRGFHALIHNDHQ